MHKISVTLRLTLSRRRNRLETSLCEAACPSQAEPAGCSAAPSSSDRQVRLPLDRDELLALMQDSLVGLAVELGLLVATALLENAAVCAALLEDLARFGPTHRRVPQPGAQRTGREHPQAGSCQTAKDDGGKPGVRFLARSKRGTRFRTASLLGGTKQRSRRFWWGETKEGDAVGGARLTIEIGAEFPIGTNHDLGGEVLVDHERPDCGMAVVRWLCEEPRPHLRETRFVIHTHDPNAACMMVLHLQVMGFQVQASPFGVVTPTGRGANLGALAGCSAGWGDTPGPSSDWSRRRGPYPRKGGLYISRESTP